ncbi:unnamed protein product [Xylocopa violacea]|uniref:PiggyBac transposable element-derived protein domain-containing protein n=1 Tax=Xylocopa violacea TaxID=135666 RepID=A0ABP1MZB3_XYLVO
MSNYSSDGDIVSPTMKRRPLRLLSSSFEDVSDEDSEPDTQSDHSISEDTDSEDCEIENENPDTNTTWDTTGGNRKPFQFSANPGQQEIVPRRYRNNCLYYMEKFLDDELISIIVTQTNLYAEQFLQSHPNLKPRSRLTKWYPTNNNEIRCFIALLILQGIRGQLGLEALAPVLTSAALVVSLDFTTVMVGTIIAIGLVAVRQGLQYAKFQVGTSVKGVRSSDGRNPYIEDFFGDFDDAALTVLGSVTTFANPMSAFSVIIAWINSSIRRGECRSSDFREAFQVYSGVPIGVTIMTEGLKWISSWSGGAEVQHSSLFFSLPSAMGGLLACAYYIRKPEIRKAISETWNGVSSLVMSLVGSVLTSVWNILTRGIRWIGKQFGSGIQSTLPAWMRPVEEEQGPIELGETFVLNRPEPPEVNRWMLRQWKKQGGLTLIERLYFFMRIATREREVAPFLPIHIRRMLEVVKFSVGNSMAGGTITMERNGLNISLESGYNDIVSVVWFEVRSNLASFGLLIVGTESSDGTQVLVVGYNVSSKLVRNQLRGLSYLLKEKSSKASTPQGLQQTLDLTTDYLAQCGLAINTGKSFTVAIRNVPHIKKSVVDNKGSFRCSGALLPAMRREDEWKYLGVPFTPEGRVTCNPEQQLQKAMAKLSRTTLKPQQILFALRVMVLPNLRKERLEALAKGGPEPLSFLAQEIEKARRRLKDGHQELDYKDRIEKRWANSLHSSVDGKALSEFRKVLTQNQWVLDRTRFLSGKDSVKLRINVLPTKSRSNRGRQGDRLCRAGCNAVETLNHIIQICPRTHAAGVARHNAIVAYVKRALAKKYTNVVEELHIKTTSGLRKPDLVATRENTVLVIDA